MMLDNLPLIFWVYTIYLINLILFADNIRIVGIEQQINDNATLEKAVSFTAYYAHYYDLPSYESNSFNDFYL